MVIVFHSTDKLRSTRNYNNNNRLAVACNTNTENNIVFSPTVGRGETIRDSILDGHTGSFENSFEKVR